MIRLTSITASMLGTNQCLPTLRRSGSNNCSAIAIATISWAGQCRSLRAGGGYPGAVSSSEAVVGCSTVETYTWAYPTRSCPCRRW